VSYKENVLVLLARDVQRLKLSQPLQAR
jgi:hypothetical protein